MTRFEECFEAVQYNSSYIIPDGYECAFTCISPFESDGGTAQVSVDPKKGGISFINFFTPFYTPQILFLHQFLKFRESFFGKKLV